MILNVIFVIFRLKDKPKSAPVKRIHITEIAPPYNTVDLFCNLYENEWFNAFEILKKAYHEDDEKAVFYLFRIVKVTSLTFNGLK